jgi:S1-C subfamily serine protease
MIAARLLDVLLVLVLLVYLGEGWRNGFVRSLSAILGVLAGGVAAFLAVPLVAAFIPSPFWRLAVSVALSIALLIAGHAGGVAIARAIRGRKSKDPLPAVDRIFGALANLVAAALVVSLIAGSVSALGVPLLTRAANGSIVLKAIQTITPDPVEQALARLRSAVLEEGIPTIGGAIDIGTIAGPAEVPDDVETNTDVLGTAAQSVVRIRGTAYACGQNQSGTGFVVAAERVVTNAHVVAGVDQPVVEAPNGQTLDGRVVYFDPDDDLAVIAVAGLSSPALPLSGPLLVGSDAVVDGYPHGGPFTSGPAEVLAVSSERLNDIYGSDPSFREVYTLAADIEPGNSGGPLLTLSGQVAGVVFARSSDQEDVGYAMTNAELQPVAQGASGFASPVSPGACIQG